jgi:murein biosynthesis integral membrane protein MurJ/undecaprenyldiphospho-muramoylpentapeptide beta-N-acetylglucosaminyltransferase
MGKELKNKMRVVFTGGGTGGHVYPNVAIYEAIREKYPESSFLYLGTARGAESKIVRNISQPIEFSVIQSKGFPQNIKSLKTVVSLFFMFMGFVKSIFVLKRFKPDVVIGSGGYVSAPVLLAAALLKFRVFIHEQNSVPGRLNLFIARFASRIGVAFASTAAFFPKNKVAITGYPLRKSITQKKTVNIKEKYAIPEHNQVLFICGGSVGSRTINRAIVEVIPDLMKLVNLTVILSTGRGYSKEYRAYDDTMAILQKRGIPAEHEGKLIIREYFDNIDEIYSISDLIVSRAGAGSIKEITASGIPSVLIPKIDLPGDHQILNAIEVQKMGGAQIVFEEVGVRDNKKVIFVPESILLKLVKDLLSNQHQLEKMRRNLQKINIHDSSKIILEEIESIFKIKEAVEEKQIRVFYLQSEGSEKSYELVFDSTTLGNSFLCDVFLDGIKDNVIFKIRNINNDEKLILKKIRGRIRLNESDVQNWTELREGDRLVIEDRAFLLKSYSEQVEQVHFEKPTASKIWGSSFGIMVSRIGGFFREIAFAAFFGAGKAMSMFAVGLTISNFMRRVVAENALENAFLPIFLRIFHRSSRKKTWEAASSIINVTVLLSIAFVLIGIAIAPALIKFLFPAFSEKGMLLESITMTRIMFPYLFLVTVASVMTTYLKAFNRFGIAESSAIFFSIGTIVGVVIFQSFAGVYSLAYGVLLGGIMQILFLLPFNLRIFRNKALGFFHSAALQLNSPSNKKYYSQLAPITIDVTLSNTSEIIAQILASGLKSGAIAFLYFAKNIFRLPFALISQAINSVILKEFSDRIALFNRDKAKKLFVEGIKTNMFLLMPVSIFMIILANPIVSIILGRGAFSQSDIGNTAYAMQFYSVGLIGWGIHSFTVRIFSARMDIKTSMVLNFFQLLVNIFFCLILVKTSLTFAGLALATSLAYLIFSVIRVMVLKAKLAKEEIHVPLKEIMGSFLKTLLASFFMVIVLIETKFIFRKIPFGSRTIENLVLLVSLLFIGTSIYFLSSLLLKNTEILIFRKTSRFKEKKTPLPLLSPFEFLKKVSASPQSYREDFFYKINIYMSSKKWEIRNIGVKLIGLFQDAGKTNLLLNILKSDDENGFIKRNALVSLGQLDFWDDGQKEMIRKLLNDSYYEVRAAAIDYLVRQLRIEDFDYFRDIIQKKLKKSSLEEKLSCLKLIARVGSKVDFDRLGHFYLSVNSLIRERLAELIYSFYRRDVLNKDELLENIEKILKTSNNLHPEFKLKTIIKDIYKELESA